MKTKTILLTLAVALGGIATTFAQTTKVEFPSPSPAWFFQ